MTHPELELERVRVILVEMTEHVLGPFAPLVFWTFVIGPLGALLAVPPACSSRRSSWTPTRKAAGSTR